jgi:hypothetical protein
MPGGMPGMPGMPGSSTGMPGMPGDSPSAPSSKPSLPGESGEGSGSSGEGESNSKSSKDGKGGSASPEGPGGDAQTSEEKRQAGEKSLDDSLGDFDKTLKKEQERVAKERDARGSAEGEGNGSDSSSTDGGGSGDGAEGGGQARSGDLKSSGPAPKDANNKGNPDAVNNNGKGANCAGCSGSGSQRPVNTSDDDIVAKRLRKAAEEETDPELKERLWKEYNEYKKSAS